MSLKFKEIKESIRINPNEIKMKVMTISGKEGDHYLVICPTLVVSGYGQTESEASASFEHNLDVFCSDLMSLSKEERELHLIKLGFSKEKFHIKKFSKSYIDEDGILQGLDINTVKTSFLEATV